MLFCITLFEILTVLLWTVYLYKYVYRGGVIVKTTVSLALLVLSLILGGQLSSLYSTGHYIETMTLSNIGSYRDVGWKILVSSALITVTVLSLTITAAVIARKSLTKVIRWPVAFYCLFFCCVNPQGAILNFGKAYHTFLDQSFFSPDAVVREQQKKLYGKDYTFDNDADVLESLDLRNKNIVVVFAEGFSAQWIGKFNKYKGLTPNLDRFLEQSVWFDNYYNHTAPTFRGLRGQLTSSYQYRGGYMGGKGFGEISDESIRKTLSGTVISIPHILKDNGYHSYFLVAHQSNYQLNLVLRILEFDKVYGADDFSSAHLDLTDQQLFPILGDLVNNHKLKSPYLLGTYNVGTHLGQDSPDVKYGDGKNQLLNTIHNFDDAFGKFWDSVKGRKDLVVILTADHAAYPSDLYNKTFMTQRKYFVDKIPLVIWGHNIKHSVIDAHGRNSLDFAPTLLQSMGIRHGFNYFLGCSLFNPACPRKFEFLHCEGEWCLETPTMRILDKSNADDATMLKKIRDFFNFSEDRRFL